MSTHHIIIGDGITAAEFATTRHPVAGDTITVIGPDVANLGRGLAYAKAPGEAPWRYAYLLNSPSRSVDQEFGDWLATNWETVAHCMSGRNPDWLVAAQQYIELDQIPSLNAPREIYGDFFHSKVRQRIQALRQQQVNIELLSTRAIDIETDGTRFIVATEDGQQLIADTIDVATGGPKIQRFEGDDSENSFPELFGNELDIAEVLGSTGNIICIGAGAAMLDLLRFCQSVQAESNIKFCAISPSGTLFKPLRPAASFNPTQYKLTGTFARAADFLHVIKDLQQQALDAGDSFYETRVGLRGLFMQTSLNEFIPNIDEARKVSVPLFQHFQGGTRDSIDDFHRLQKTGGTNIIAGHVIKIEQGNDLARVTYRDKNGQIQKTNASAVVNCAGPGRHNNFDVLTNAMLGNQWISACEHSGGIRVGAMGHTSLSGMRYLGPAVTSIGSRVEPVPLYDAYRLRLAVQSFNQFNEG